MHIYIPLEAKYTYDQSQMFGRLFANLVHQQIPDFTSVERQIKNRNGKEWLLRSCIIKPGLSEPKFVLITNPDSQLIRLIPVQNL